MKRVKGEGHRQRLEITLPILLRFYTVLPADPYWAAMFACCVFGVFGLLRRFNLVLGSLCLPDQEKHLLRSDIEFDAERYALRVTVRFSKTLCFQNRVHMIWIQGDPSATPSLTRCAFCGAISCWSCSRLGPNLLLRELIWCCHRFEL